MTGTPQPKAPLPRAPPAVPSGKAARPPPRLHVPRGEARWYQRRRKERTVRREPRRLFCRETTCAPRGSKLRALATDADNNPPSLSRKSKRTARRSSGRSSAPAPSLPLSPPRTGSPAPPLPLPLPSTRARSLRSSLQSSAAVPAPKWWMRRTAACPPPSLRPPSCPGAAEAAARAGSRTVRDETEGGGSSAHRRVRWMGARQPARRTSIGTRSFSSACSSASASGPPLASKAFPATSSTSSPTRKPPSAAGERSATALTMVRTVCGCALRGGSRRARHPPFARLSTGSWVVRTPRSSWPW
mmetsp:Transcript_665/g.1933  ORF Transcript_665/g.1933 Transcript_665/m.1933 type:complete len:301 (-) Transcript_665:406-1308(-)